MGWWNGTKLGFKVDAAEEELAQQFLTILGVNLVDCGMTEEIGEFSDLDDYTADGLVEGDLLGIMPSLEKKFTDYQEQFNVFDDEEDGDEEGIEEAETESDIQLDDLFQAAKIVFSRPSMYLAHEDGNNTSDTFYRYEAVYSSGRKIEWNCYYSYGDGVNTASENPKEEGAEKTESKIIAKKPGSALVSKLIKKAEAEGFDELVRKLKGNPAKPAGAADKAKKEVRKKIPGMKIVKGTLVRYSGKSEFEVIIPEGVTEIGENAFKDNDSVSSVVIPEGVKSIGKYAFYHCLGLKKVSLPRSLEVIGDCAFQYCRITEMVIPEGVKKIGDFAFCGCEYLEDIKIPQSIKSIGCCAFYDCYRLAHVILPPGIKEISDKLFNSCKALKTVDIPKSVKRIGEWAFMQCEELTEINLPAGLKEIGERAFEGCCKLNKLIIPKKAAAIGWHFASGSKTEIHISSLESWFNMKTSGALANGNKLFADGVLVENLIVPSAVTTINDFAFSNYEYLVNVTIPETVTDIGRMAFMRCKHLKKAVIPKALEKMAAERDVFKDCEELAEIEYY